MGNACVSMLREQDPAVSSHLLLGETLRCPVCVPLHCQHTVNNPSAGYPPPLVVPHPREDGPPPPPGGRLPSDGPPLHLVLLHFTLNSCTCSPLSTGTPPPLSFPTPCRSPGGGGRHLVNPKFFVAAHCVVVWVTVVWGTATCIPCTHGRTFCSL